MTRTVKAGTSGEISLSRIRRCLGLIVACTCLLYASSAAAIDLRNASIEHLDNGLTIILLEDRNFPVASVQMAYRVGARNEVTGLTGLAHFVEHMAFRASENFPDTGLVSNIYARGGEWHGYTWTDLTTYFATVPARDLDLLLRIEADRMARLDLSPAVIEAERGAVLAEMHMYENDPSSMLVDALMFTSFLVHPYRNNTIGIESDIDAITYDDVDAFYKAHYHPGNAVLAVVGDFDRELVAARIGELFAPIEGRPPTPLPHTVEPQQTGERQVRVSGSSDARRFAIGYRAPSSNHADLPAFLVLQALLADSSGVSFLQNDWGTPARPGSVLHGAAVDVATWYPPSAQDYIFMISGQPGSGQAEAEVESAIEERLKSVRGGRPSARQLRAAIDDVLDELVYDVETTEDAAHQLAYFESIGALDALLRLPASVSAVSADDVHRVAATYLAPGQRTIAWYEPRHGSAPAQVPERPRALPSAGEPVTPDLEPVPAAQLRRLAGGLPLIIQPSDFSDTVEIRTVIAGADRGRGDLVADDPVSGFSSRTMRVRPGGLAAAFAGMQASIEAAGVSAAASPGLSADPETRLEQTFTSLMGTAGSAPVDASPVVLVVAGNVEADTVAAFAEEHFGDVPPSSWRPGPAGAVPAGERLVELDAPVAQAALGYIVQAPGARSADFDAWQILLYVLSHGYEGRLGVEAISRRGLAYYIDSRYRSDGRNGWITLAIGVDPGKLDDLKALLVEELGRLERQPPTEAEVAEAKAWLLGRAESEAQSNRELARKLAADWLLFDDLVDTDELAERLANITIADVRRAAGHLAHGAVVAVRHGG